jgi:hypothetical protein
MDDKIRPNDMYIETSMMNLLDENIDKSNYSLDEILQRGKTQLLQR